MPPRTASTQLGDPRPLRAEACHRCRGHCRCGARLLRLGDRHPLPPAYMEGLVSKDAGLSAEEAALNGLIHWQLFPKWVIGDP